VVKTPMQAKDSGERVESLTQPHPSRLRWRPAARLGLVRHVKSNSIHNREDASLLGRRERVR